MRKATCAGYAEEKVQAGNWEKEEAPALAEKEFRALLPDGINTKDNFLYSIIDGESGQKVGIIWIAVNVPGTLKGDLFVYDFEIFEKFRRKGYATGALKLLGVQARSWGRIEFPFTSLVKTTPRGSCIRKMVSRKLTS